MRVLIVYCHPDEKSFSHHLKEVSEKVLLAAGCEVRILDLYKLGFDPVMRKEELLVYHNTEINEASLKNHLDLLRWCEGLLFVYPTWWGGLPAMLKGWIDKALLPNVAFTEPDEKIPWKPLLTQIRVVGVVTTFGSSRWLASGMTGSAGRKTLLRTLRACFSVQCKTLWLALYKVDVRSTKQRESFVSNVEKKLLRSFVR